MAVFRCDSDFGSRLETRVCNGKGLVRIDLPDVPDFYTIDDYVLKKFHEVNSENKTFSSIPLEALDEILDESAIQNSKGLVFFLGDERIQGYISHHYFCISSEGRFNVWYSPEINCSTRSEKRSWVYWNGPSYTIYLIKYDGKKANEKLFDLKGYRQVQ